MPQVVDNTVLTNFCLVDRLDILHSLFGNVYVTQQEGNELLCQMAAAGYRSPYEDLRDMDQV